MEEDSEKQETSKKDLKIGMGTICTISAVLLVGFSTLFYYVGLNTGKGKSDELKQNISEYKERQTADSLKIIELNKGWQTIKEKLSKYTSKEILPTTTLCPGEGKPILGGALVVSYEWFSGKEFDKAATVCIESEERTLARWSGLRTAEQHSFKFQDKEYTVSFLGFDESNNKGCIKLSIHQK